MTGWSIYDDEPTPGPYESDPVLARYQIPAGQILQISLHDLMPVVIIPSLGPYPEHRRVTILRGENGVYLEMETLS